MIASAPSFFAIARLILWLSVRLDLSRRAFKPTLKLGDIQRRLSLMEHRMAVRANGNQVLLRVNGITLANLTQRPSVVNVDESPAEFAVDRLKVEIADLTDSAKVGNASTPSTGVSLVTVDRGVRCRALPERLIRRNVVREQLSRPLFGWRRRNRGISSNS